MGEKIPCYQIVDYNSRTFPPECFSRVAHRRAPSCDQGSTISAGMTGGYATRPPPQRHPGEVLNPAAPRPLAAGTRRREGISLSESRGYPLSRCASADQKGTFPIPGRRMARCKRETPASGRRPFPAVASPQACRAILSGGPSASRPSAGPCRPPAGMTGDRTTRSATPPLPLRAPAGLLPGRHAAGGISCGPGHGGPCSPRRVLGRWARQPPEIAGMPPP